MHNHTETTTPEDLTVRARAEFREMPGMCLTTAQAARLWQLSPARAEALLSELVQCGFLVRRDGQRYRLPSSV
jgi:DNA-binding IclR family transcriptional regulator